MHSEHTFQEPCSRPEPGKASSLTQVFPAHNHWKWEEPRAAQMCIPMPTQLLCSRSLRAQRPFSAPQGCEWSTSFSSPIDCLALLFSTPQQWTTNRHTELSTNSHWHKTCRPSCSKQTLIQIHRDIFNLHFSEAFSSSASLASLCCWLEALTPHTQCSPAPSMGKELSMASSPVPLLSRDPDALVQTFTSMTCGLLFFAGKNP